MSVEEAMQEIRERGRKGPVISTVSAQDLVERPKEVDGTYSWYIRGYLPLGDVDRYFEDLKRWTIENKSCAKGAIVGEYGYGKTGTGIYLWKRCEKEEIIATPPFSWRNIQDLIDGIYGWVRYKLNFQPMLREELESIYKGYKEKNIESVAKEMGVDVENVKRLEEYRINSLLKWTVNEFIEFLAKTEKIILKGKFKGLVVFTDELQSTVEAYPSPAKFLDDLFNLVNTLKSQKGNCSIILEMPTETETYIQDARGDIIDRLKEEGLYLRCDDMFQRDFPKVLWQHYGSIYQFDPIEIASFESLDALYQIAFRRDLGAGPRSVIEAFGAIANHWLEKKLQFSPIDLIDSYLHREISFAKGERLVRAIKECLESSIIKNDDSRIKLIKLLGAFPEYGCPNEVIVKHALKEVLDELFIKERAYGQVIQELTEGYTLTSLLKPEATLEKTYGRIIREFVRRYSEDEESTRMALDSFVGGPLQEIFRPQDKGPLPPFEKWKETNVMSGENCTQIDLVGSFSERFPYRKITVVATTDKPDTAINVDDLGFFIYLNPSMESAKKSTIEIINDNKVLLHLNLKCSLDITAKVPGIEIIPKDRITPLFYLSLLKEIDDHYKQIPAQEYGEVKTIQDLLLKDTIQCLFGNSNIEDCTGLDLKAFGVKIFTEVFEKLMERRYPNYHTLIKTKDWRESLEPYIHALKNTKLTLSVKRGKERFKETKDEACELFDIESKQSLKIKLDNMESLIEYSWGRAEDPVELLFKMHPLEEEILSILKKSTKTTLKDGRTVHTIDKSTILAESQKIGYLHEGIEYIKGLTSGETEFALELLRERGFIQMENSEIFELIYSIEDYKKRLETKIDDINTILEGAKILPTIDLSVIESELKELPEISSISSIEECEKIDRDATEIESKIELSLRNEMGAIKQDSDKLRHQLQLFINSELPSDLSAPKEGTVSWISELNECGRLLKEKYKGLLSDAKKISKDINTLQKAIERWENIDSSTKGIDIFNDFAEISKNHNKIKSDAEEVQDRVKGVKQEVQDYVHWEEVVKKAGDTNENAKNTETTYNNSEFVEKLKNIFGEIQNTLDQRKIDALRDWEIFRNKIEAISTEITKWQSTKRNEFIRLKTKYEENLKEIDVKEYKLRSSFDVFDPEGSFENLYSEVIEVLERYVDSLRTKANSDFNRLRYYSFIGVKNLDELISRSFEIKQGADNIKVDIESIKEDSIWVQLTDKIKWLLDQKKTLNENMSGLTKPQQLSSDEENIYKRINEIGECEITEIILDTLSKEKEKFNLDAFMQKILSLHKKQRVIIKLSSRR